MQRRLPRPLQELPRWEPEPLRWLGYKAIIHSFAHKDRVLATLHSAPGAESWPYVWRICWKA